MQIDRIITDYVKSKETDFAIMIDGEWGSGKSWYWDHVLAEQIKNIPTSDSTEEKPSNYKVASISLFGISSVDDLRIKIFEETSPIFANKYVKTGAKLTGMVLNKVASFFNVSETSAKDVSDVLGEFSVNLDHYVLCFDDLERIKPSLLIELLGYINNLVEHDKVKVVFICNEDELKDVDYHKYKEKIVRFTHTIKSDISEMVVEFAKGRKESYSNYLVARKDYIASVYQKGNCSNLRTLKFNLDIFEHIYNIILTTIRTDEGNTLNVTTDYMLLLSMVYSIEYRRDNNEAKLKSLAEINRSWSYQQDTLEGLRKHSCDVISDEKQESQEKKSDKERIHDYQLNVRKCYLANTYICGSSLPMIEYLLTGYCDEDAIKNNIIQIATEVKRCETSEEKRLYQELIQFWDTDDNVMSKAVERTMERVNEGSFLMQDYPLFFLALQRLQNFGFIDLKISVAELQHLFDSAISKSEHDQYVDGLDSYYYQDGNVSTPEYVSLVNKVKEINAHNKKKILSAEFDRIVNNVNSADSLNKYEHVLIPLFKNIGAERFFELFVSYHNCRKRDFWNFFDERYKFKDYYDLDKEFIDNLRNILNKYLSDQTIEASGTRKYCSKVLELLDQKEQQFGEQLK